jgi:hypothetical protein
VDIDGAICALRRSASSSNATLRRATAVTGKDTSVFVGYRAMLFGCLGEAFGSLLINSSIIEWIFDYWPASVDSGTAAGGFFSRRWMAISE